MPSPGISYGDPAPTHSGAQLALVVMGVSGIGKTTIGSRLAEAMGYRFHEGDDLHSVENIAKMRAGTPLTDDDRWPWLERIAGVIKDGAQSGCVVSCSALKRIYRDYLVRMSGAPLLFVHPLVNPAIIAYRMAARENHYMPPGLLDSQLLTFEPPADDEPVISVPGGDNPDTVVHNILSEVRSRTA